VEVKMVADSLISALKQEQELEAEHVHRVLKDETLRQRLIDYIKGGCPDVSASVMDSRLDPEEEARRYLGQRFLPPQKLIEAFNFQYSAEQLDRLAGTVGYFRLFQPFSRELILVAGPPTDLNLLEVRELYPSRFAHRVRGWFTAEKERFSRVDVVKAGQWLVILPEGVPGTENMDYQTQKGRVPDTQRVPNAAEVCYAILAMVCLNEQDRLGRISVRTGSFSHVGCSTTVQYYPRAGIIEVNDDLRNEVKRDGVRIAAAI